MICLISLNLLKKFIMQTLTSTALAHSVIETLLHNLEQHLRKEQLKKGMVSQLGRQSLFCIFACFDLQTLKPQIIERKTQREDQLMSVPHISKDRLMPKEIENQQPLSQLQNRSSISKTFLGNKKVSNLSSRNPLHLTSRPSSLLTKSQRYEKSQEKQESQCKQLKSEAQIDDPEIQFLRERTEIRLHYDFQYRKLQNSHEKSYRQKSEIMSSLIEEEPTAILTHDYDGQQIKSVLGDDKIKHYTVKMGVGPSKISGKNNKKSLQPLESQISFQRNLKQRQLHRNLRPMEMPLFQQQRLQAKITNGIESYRLNEYKKHFAKGYSRLDSMSKTIEYTNTKDQEDYFAEKRHLKDTLQTSNVVSSSMQNSRVARRLALPKLHGRYKCLDRYEQQ